MDINILSILIGGGLLGFIQWAVDKLELWHGKNDKVADAIKTLSANVSELRESMAERDAILARTHILRFNDELLNDVTHSHEYFLQTLDDCKTYDDFCESHPKFSNGRTIQAEENIRRTYERLFDDHKF